MKNQFKPGYCGICGEYKTKVVVRGGLMASCNLDPLDFVDFVVEGSSISRLIIEPTKSCKDYMEEKTMVDLMVHVRKFCIDLDMGDCPDCGMPIIVPWYRR